MIRPFQIRASVFALLCAWSMAAPAAAADESDAAHPENWSLGVQSTFVVQYHPAFRSPYHGANSLDPGSRGDETFDFTIFFGGRLWQGGEAYINPEIDQGFGLSGTYGAAGFFSGEAYKVGASRPYVRIPRLFLRQTFDLGGEEQKIEPGPNQVAASRTADNIVVTLGKFSVTDIFDTNTYAHDPRADFLNWSVIDAGAFDYAADSWAYTYGGAVEWTQDWWTWRVGVFDLSRVPNSKFLQRDFEQFEAVSEIEARTDIGGQPGKIKLLGYVNRGRMADYSNAVSAAAGSGNPPTLAPVRDYASRPGVSLNIEQALGANWGAFLRLSADDGSKEAYEFTEINRSISGGISIAGALWNRPNDRLGFAGVVNDLSKSAQSYFAAGGIGLLIGDGALTHYATEDIFEVFYNIAISEGARIGLDYQFMAHPAYNADRGPVSAFALRLHQEI